MFKIASRTYLRLLRRDAKLDDTHQTPNRNRFKALNWTETVPALLSGVCVYTNVVCLCRAGCLALLTGNSMRVQAVISLQTCVQHHSHPHTAEDD